MEDNTLWCVYIHISPSNKVYVGITSKDPHERWNNGWGYYKNNYFWKAIQKYGWDNFEHKILFKGLTKEEACKKEVELIAFYNSTNRNSGYNLSIGGSYGALGVVRSKETKEKLRKANLGKRMSDDVKQKMSESSSRKKAVQQFDINGQLIAEYCSISVAEKETQTTAPNIIACCNGDQITAGGFIWKYKDAVVVLNIRKDCRKKMVLQFTKDGEQIANYNSVSDAEKATGISRKSIERCCRNQNKSACGYVWKYYDDQIDFDSVTYIEYTYQTKAVVQFTKQGVRINQYVSAQEAERYTGISEGNIQQCCRRKTKSSGGFVWRYDDDLSDINEIKNNRYYHSYNNNHILQFDLNDNFVAEYKTSIEAQNATGISCSNIKRCCRGEQNTAGGFKWKRKVEQDISFTRQQNYYKIR